MLALPYLKKASDICTRFNTCTLNVIEKTCFLLSDDRIVKQTAKSCCDILKLRCEVLYQ